MRHITLDEQLSVVTKVHHANEAIAAAYPGSRRIVCLKTDRAGMAVYIHGEDLKLEGYLSVDPVEWQTTVDGDLAAVHSELDRIIRECNERRADLFFGGLAGCNQEATAELHDN